MHKDLNISLFSDGQRTNKKGMFRIESKKHMVTRVLPASASGAVS